MHSASWEVFYVPSSKSRAPGQGGEGVESCKASIGSWSGWDKLKLWELFVEELSFFLRIPTKRSRGKSEARSTTVSKSKENNVLLCLERRYYAVPCMQCDLGNGF